MKAVSGSQPLHDASMTPMGFASDLLVKQGVSWPHGPSLDDHAFTEHVGLRHIQ